MRFRRVWFWPALACLFLTLLACLAWPKSGPDSDKLRVTILDVGQGDCLVIQTPGNRVIVIDGGGSNDENEAKKSEIGEKIVVPFLHYNAVNRVDILLLTHPHGDHVGGLISVLRNQEIGIVLDGTTLPYPSPAYGEFRDIVARKSIPYKRAARGMTLDLGDGVKMEILNPPAAGTPYGTNPDNAAVNNYSAVVKLTYGNTKFLLEGDAQNEAEDAMLAANLDVTCDVLKCGHHGAANATSDAFLDRVQPKYAAISCGAHNNFGHPSPATLARLAAHDVQVFRTDKNGAITFVSDGKTVITRLFVPSK